jgi:hypothetical protein
LRAHCTELKTAKIVKIGSLGEKLCAWEVHYSHCSKLGQNSPWYDRSEIPCPVLPFSRSMAYLMNSGLRLLLSGYSNFFFV